MKISKWKKMPMKKKTAAKGIRSKSLSGPPRKLSGWRKSLRTMIREN
jgi:hypothetical protein